MASAEHLYTLRGHHVGVTAIAQYDYKDCPCLISGDQEGTLIIWNLVTFKQINSHPKLIPSQVQSLKAIELQIEQEKHKVLVVQSRNDGVYLLDLATENLKQLATFGTYEALFSRGDAFARKDSTALLAYPSPIGNHFVSVRLIGADAKTILSGHAKRFEDEESNKVSVFDIVIKEVLESNFRLFVAYEDATICAFAIDLDELVSVPVLRVTGLKIDMIRKFNLDFKDFITSFDVQQTVDEQYQIICGSPTKNVYIITAPKNLESSNTDTTRILQLQSRGVSSIVSSTDCKVAALACWDSSVILYSIDTTTRIATLLHHMKQIQYMSFLNSTNILTDQDSGDTDDEQQQQQSESDSCSRGRLLLCCASMDGTISLTCIK